VPGAAERLSAALVDRYTIERELGQGGMATVYLAHDLKHDRPVALKVLRPELAVSLGAERFLAEIRLTAKLQHPHIVPLFDSGRTGGQADRPSGAAPERSAIGHRLSADAGHRPSADFLYYVMPYIEGESLRARLERETRLDVEAMLAIARPVAQALAYAHELGIVHRDIKPENILLCRGQPFVTDFGIARAVTVAGGERLTGTGVAIGTPAYMSPEQALGEPSVDARSDVYSLGCVIYEMLAGSPPFAGPTVQALIARRLAGPPPHLTTVPSPVDEVVRRSLATAPQDRFATAIALAEALVEAARKPATPEKSLVVLPFENLSPDPDNAFFADGLTEELIADLSKVRALRVISRTSAMHYKGTTEPLPEIARELNVRYVLEGSVRRAANSLRITAQLIDAMTDAHLWAEKYSGTLEDVFEIQERVSREIVEALRITLAPDERAAMAAARPIRDVRAYDYYLHAMHQIWNLNEASLRQAIHDLEAAMEIVGESAVLYAGIGSLYWQLFGMGIDASDETLERVRRCAERAMELEPDSAHGHRLLAFLKLHEGDTVGAAASLERCLQADPQDTEALVWAGYVNALFLGRPARAVPLYERLAAIDPLMAARTGGVAAFEGLTGRWDRAVEGWERAVIRDPGHRMARWYYAHVLALCGRTAEAIAQFDKVSVEVAHDGFGPMSELFARALEGRIDDALRAIPAESMSFLWNDVHACWLVADSYAAAGRTDDALKWLARAVEMGFKNYPVLADRDPFLATLKGEPRFKQLIASVKTEWEGLAP
jgi:serine/threonine protein kinase/tetratricopeptide (TPR) repeat protein